MVESTPQSSPGELTGNLGWLLAQASHALSTEMTAAFEAGGATPRGHCVLSTARTGEFTQKELADMVGLDKTTMVVTVDALEAAGLAERVPSPHDRRARVISVTAAGESVVERGREGRAAHPGRDPLDAPRRRARCVDGRAGQAGLRAAFRARRVQERAAPQALKHLGVRLPPLLVRSR